MVSKYAMSKNKICHVIIYQSNLIMNSDEIERHTFEGINPPYRLGQTVSGIEPDRETSLRR